MKKKVAQKPKKRQEKDFTEKAFSVNQASEFHDRLMEVLDTQKKTWWNRQLGVSASLIGSRWVKGSPPKTDKIIKICELAGVSANWLLLGIGPKYISSTAASREEELNRRDIQEYIIQLEETKNDIEQLLLKLSDRDKTLHIIMKLSNLLNTEKIALPFDRMDELSGEEFFNEYILPLIVFLRSVNDVTSKAAEFVSKSEYGKSFVITVLKWLRTEQERNILHYKGRLKELDSLFKADDFKDLADALEND